MWEYMRVAGHGLGGEQVFLFSVYTDIFFLVVVMVEVIHLHTLIVSLNG